MSRLPKSTVCPIHRTTRHRASCRQCNNAYMREYLRRRSRERPSDAVWERARRRAARLGIQFNLPRGSLTIPAFCPVLGIPMGVGPRRSAHSPSLDRIVPAIGYVPTNVRVISDRANRLKGNRSLQDLRARAAQGGSNQDDYAKTAAYVDRELLLGEVRAKASGTGRGAAEWQKVAEFLDRAFANGQTE